MTQVKPAFVTTIIVWFVLFLFIVLVPMPTLQEQEKIFGEMTIKLDALPERASTEIAHSTFQEETFTEQIQTVDRVIQNETISQEVQTVEQPRNVQSSSASAVEPSREQVLSRSIEDLIAEQNNRTQSNRQTQWSDDVFSTSNAVTSTQNQVSESAPKQSSSSLSGAAAQSNPTSSAAIQGETVRSNTNSGSVSSETSNLLSNIASTQPSLGGTQQSSSGTQRQQTNATSFSTASGYDFNFEGEARRLLYPANPTLEISSENQRLIQGTRSVQVALTVSPNGTISPSSITFTPSALVPREVQSELRQQIATWRFEEGPGSGQATFIYSIIVE